MSLVEPQADIPPSETASRSLDPHGADKDSKRTFLRMVSHELRTPLNSIIGFSDILHQELYGPLGSPHYVEYAGIIKESGTKLLHLFNNFLEIVRLESGGALDCAAEPVLPMFEEAAARVRNVVQARGVRLDIRLHNEDLCARIEPRALTSCLDQLLGNAIDFTPAGENIELDAWRCGDMIELSVFNYGDAPDPDDIGRLMKPFEQGSTAVGRTREGAGLGWAIVRLNCLAMGGAFGVVAHKGESLRAILRLKA